MEYEIARQLADTWGLVVLVVLFLGAVAFAFRPGSKKQYEKDAMIPLRDDEVEDV